VKYLLSYLNHIPTINKIVFLLGFLGILVSVIQIKVIQNEELTLFFDNMHWTFATTAAAILATLGYFQNKSSFSVKTYYWFFIGFLLYAIGQIVWDLQVFYAYYLFPSPSDIFYLCLGPSIIIALFYEVYSRKDKVDISIFLLDLCAISIAALTLLFVSYLPQSGDLDVFSIVVMVAYPTSLLIPVFMLVLMIPSMRLRLNGSLILFLLSMIYTAWSWMHWNSLALDGIIVNGSWSNISFSIGIILAGLAVSNWKLEVTHDERVDRLGEAFLRFLPLITVVLISISIVIIDLNIELSDLANKIIYVGAAIVIIIATIRQSHLLQERDDLLQAQAQVLESASLINSIIQTVPMRIFWKDRDLKYLGCNDLFAQDAGFESSKEIIGKTDFDMGWKDQAELYRVDDTAVMDSGKAILGYEEPQTTPDGTEIWLRTSKVPLVDALNGETIGILGIYDDITQYKIIENLLKENESFLQESQSNAGIGSYSLDMQTLSWKSSDTLNQIFGIDESYEKNLNSWVSLIYPDDQEKMDTYVKEYVMQKHNKFDREYRIVRANDNDVRWVHGLGRLEFDDSGALLRMSGTIQDITVRKKIEEKIQLSANVFTYANEGIMLTNIEGAIIDVNDAFTRITGYTKEDVLGKNPKILNSQRQGKAFYSSMWDTLLKKGYWDGELWNRRKDGEFYAQLLNISAIKDSKGEVQHYVALFSDITASKEYEHKLEYIAHYDSLTGLPNRILNSDRIRQAMVQSLRRDEKVAIVYLDLDSFKEVNDQFGHHIGDKLLIALAENMKAELREGDTLSRLGGDEFVAILTDIKDITSALPILQRLVESVSKEVRIDDILLNVSASIGATFYPQVEEVDADQLIRQADQAMYEAKRSGKNHYHIFDSEYDRSVRTRHENVDRIHQALLDNEFVLYYQPKINMRTNAIVGAEALIRWQHPDEGLIPPLKFLPLIENNPLSVEIGEWVINEAISQMQRWKKQGFEIPVSVNVGARQLLQGDFSKSLESILAKYENFNFSLLELEVLETSALEDINRASSIMQKCKDLGVDFALDDFGTGYSSLTYLKKLPIKTLKIDQSFVRDMLEDDDDLAILDGIVNLSKAFGCEVIAEGVETQKHAKELLLLGCELAQGYGIAKPMPAEQLYTWSKEWDKEAKWIV